MFKTDETVRFGQILSARILRYGKFNEYIIIIIITRVSCPASAANRRDEIETVPVDMFLGEL